MTTTEAPSEQKNPFVKDYTEIEQVGLPELIGLVQAVDLATQRGAYRAPELEGVGALYNKLACFVMGVQKKQAAAEQSKTDEEGVKDPYTPSDP